MQILNVSPKSWFADDKGFSDIWFLVWDSFLLEPPLSGRQAAPPMSWKAPFSSRQLLGEPFWGYVPHENKICQINELISKSHLDKQRSSLLPLKVWDVVRQIYFDILDEGSHTPGKYTHVQMCTQHRYPKRPIDLLYSNMHWRWPWIPHCGSIRQRRNHKRWVWFRMKK